MEKTDLKTKRIFTVGHRGPDLDSVVSAIAYAEFLQRTERYNGAKIIPTCADPLNKETELILREYNVNTPTLLSDVEFLPNDKIILVDHNEESQRHASITPNKILEIVDHHKVNLNLETPIRIEIKPWGSTASIIWDLYDQARIQPESSTQKLLLAAIISDTQGLKSSTTTEKDKIFAQSLAEATQTNLEDLIFTVFKAKSDIEGLTPKDLTKKDYKIFEFGNEKVFINQIETVEPRKLLDIKENLIKSLEEIKKEDGTGIGYIIITDILKENSTLLFSTEQEKEIAQEAFDTTAKGGVMNIGARTSRKKDIAPEIERAIKEGETV